MVTERKIYEDQGLEEYVAYQRDHENEPLMPGPAFPFVKVGPNPAHAHLLHAHARTPPTHGSPAA